MRSEPHIASHAAPWRCPPGTRHLAIWGLECIPAKPAFEQLDAMRATTLPPAISRDADNELYDRGCDLVEAASAIRRAADSHEAGRAVPAVLGCIEAALQELVMASAALEQTTV